MAIFCAKLGKTYEKAPTRPKIGCRGECLNPSKELLLDLGLIFAESDLFANLADGLGGDAEKRQGETRYSSTPPLLGVRNWNVVFPSLLVMRKSVWVIMSIPISRS